MGEMLTIAIRNEVREIRRLMEIVNGFLAGKEVSERGVYVTNLALDELVGNIIKYGYTDGQGHEIGVDVRIEAGHVVIRIEDDGREFNPCNVPEPDNTKPIEERMPGGLGIFLVRKLVESLEYERRGDRNVVVLRIPR